MYSAQPTGYIIVHGGYRFKTRDTAESYKPEIFFFFALYYTYRLREQRLCIMPSVREQPTQFLAHKKQYIGRTI